MQENLFDKDHLIAMQMNEGSELEWHMPASYPDLTGYKQIAVDLETCDPHLTTLGPGWARKEGFIVGIAIAAGDESWYFPIRHQNGHNLDPKMTMKWLKTQMATPRIDKIMHNATYDLGWLRAEGVDVQGRVIDTMITGAIVDENRYSYSLNNLGRDYLELSGRTRSSCARLRLSGASTPRRRCTSCRQSTSGSTQSRTRP
jgi:hypothetical protein